MSRNCDHRISINRAPIHRILACLLAGCLLLVLSGCGSNIHEPSSQAGESFELRDDQKLVIYTAHKPEIYEPIIREFEERCGVFVEVTAGGTNEILQRISEEEERHPGKSEADLMFGGGVDSLRASSEYFEPYVSSQSENLDSTYASATDSYTVFSALPTVLIYNTRLVDAGERPKAWADLLNPRWKGKIAFADPETSGSAYTALLTFLQVLSEEDAHDSESEILAQFVDNLSGDVIHGSENVVSSVISGTKLIGVTTEEVALKKRAEGASIGVVYPAEGTAMLPDGTAILKGCPHPENARLFLEFTVSKDVQRMLSDYLYRRSVRTDLDSAAAPTAIRYDIDHALDSRDDILASWAEEVSQSETE